MTDYGAVIDEAVERLDAGEPERVTDRFTLYGRPWLTNSLLSVAERRQCFVRG